MLFLSLLFLLIFFFFFFKQKTAYEMRISDWSSDVCSSDLCKLFERVAGRLHPTAEALLLKEELDEVFTRIETFKRLAHDLSDGRRGSLTVEIGRASCRERVCQYV